MKTCPVCGETYSDRIDFCFQEGAVLQAMPSALDAPLPRRLAPAPELAALGAPEPEPPNRPPVPSEASELDDDLLDAPPIPEHLKRELPPPAFAPAPDDEAPAVDPQALDPVLQPTQPERTAPPASAGPPAPITPAASVVDDLLPDDTDDEPLPDELFDTAPSMVPSEPSPAMAPHGQVLEGFDDSGDDTWVDVATGPSDSSMATMRWMVAIAVFAALGGIGWVLATSERGAPTREVARAVPVHIPRPVQARAEETPADIDATDLFADGDDAEVVPLPEVDDAEPPRIEPSAPRPAHRSTSGPRASEPPAAPSPATTQPAEPAAPPDPPAAPQAVAPASAQYLEQIARNDPGVQLPTEEPAVARVATIDSTPATEPPPPRAGTALVFYEGRDGAQLVVDGVTRGVLPARVRLSEGPHTFIVRSPSGDTTVRRDVVLSDRGVTLIRLRE